MPKGDEGGQGGGERRYLKGASKTLRGLRRRYLKASSQKTSKVSKAGLDESLQASSRYFKVASSVEALAEAFEGTLWRRVITLLIVSSVCQSGEIVALAACTLRFEAPSWGEPWFPHCCVASQVHRL